MLRREIPSWLLNTFDTLTVSERGTVLAIWQQGLLVSPPAEVLGKRMVLWEDFEQFGLSWHSVKECVYLGRTPVGVTSRQLSPVRLWQYGDDGSAWAWMRVCLEQSGIEEFQNLLPEVDEWGLYGQG